MYKKRCAALIGLTGFLQRVVSGAEFRRLLDLNKASQLRRIVTHHLCIDGCKGGITATLYPDGKPIDFSIRFDDCHPEVSGMLSAVAKMAPAAIRHGIPLEVFFEDIRHIPLGPRGSTRNPHIPVVHNVIDYFLEWLKYEGRIIARSNQPLPEKGELVQMEFVI